MGRRKNGQGLIRQRKDGRWEGRCVVGYDEKNLPITKNVLAKTKREVEEKLKALKETVQKTVVKTAADMPFGEYIDYWYRNFCELSIAATTRLKYENDIYKHIIPGIGKLPLAALKKSDLEKFYAEQMKSGNLDRNGVGDKKLSGAVIRSMHTRIKCALDRALKEGLVNRNGAVGCKLPPKKNKEIEVLSHEEIARLLIQAKEEGFYELILLGLATGMRRGELLGLKWDDINFTTGELSIRREYTTLGSDYIISTPKTKSSVRSVHLPQSVLNILGEYRETVSSEWVFPSPLDPTHPRSPTSCRSRLSDMLERAECNHIPFHGLRHIFSTMALENGLDIKTLSAVLGHSSAETTISVYSHVTGEMERNAAKKMDDAFGTPKPADLPINGKNPDDRQTPESEPKPAEFTAKKSKKRKPGTGCISKVSKNTWQGKYTPRGKDGKREQYIVYAKSEEACERKLVEMIEKLKSNEITIA